MTTESEFFAFVRQYERATNTHDPTRVSQLVAEDATYWFTDGSRFRWSGVIDGQPKSGEGRGTNIAVRHDSAWQMLHEHLSV